MEKKNINKKQNVGYPKEVVKPLAKFLNNKLVELQKTKKAISKEDPFKDKERLLDNASPDADAAEQFGHARTSAISQAITKKIVQVRKALTRIKIGKYGNCEDCGKMIDTDRLVAFPEATVCISCERKKEK